MISFLNKYLLHMPTYYKHTKSNRYFGIDLFPIYAFSICCIIIYANIKVWRIKRERIPPPKKNPNRATSKRERERERERGNPWLELSYSLNPPPGDTVSNSLLYYSLTTPSLIVLSILWVQRVFYQPLLHPSFIVGKAHWLHAVNLHKYCNSSAYSFSSYIKALHTKQRQALLWRR